MPSTPEYRESLRVMRSSRFTMTLIKIGAEMVLCVLGLEMTPGYLLDRPVVAGKRAKKYAPAYRTYGYLIVL